MENKNIQRSRSACNLTWPFPAGMVYKCHLGGVAMVQYTVTPGLWTWSWRAQVSVVPGVHKEKVSGPLKPANKCRHIIKHVKSITTQLYISKEHANYTMRFMQIRQ